eukprot:71498-Amphidinium_carterae.1
MSAAHGRFGVCATSVRSKPGRPRPCSSRPSRGSLGLFGLLSTCCHIPPGLLDDRDRARQAFTKLWERAGPVNGRAARMR